MADFAAIYDRYIEYAANLVRVDATTRLKVYKLLAEVEQELIDALEEADPTGVRTAYQKGRLQQLLGQTKKMIDQKYKEINGVVTDDLRDLAQVEVAFAAKVVNDFIGVELISTMLTPGMIRNIMSDTLIVGAPSADWWSRQSYNLQRRFADEIRRGMLQGETIDELSRRIRGTSTGRREGYTTASGTQKFNTKYAGGIMDIQRREADALVRSSFQAVSQRARFEMYKENDDVVEGVQALVVLDARTSTFCMSISGQAWELDGTPIGNSRPWPGYPPFHFNCRTTFVPLLTSWEDLAPAHKKRLAREADRNALDIETMQSSMDGPVKGSLTYEDWLRTKPLTFQEELLGPSKYKLWSQGKISFRDLIDQSGNPLTVDELKQRFG